MRGFTLIELILVLALTAIIGGLSVPFMQSFQVSSDLATYANTIERTLRRARQQAVVGQNNDSWGVFLNTATNEITLFYGDDYTTRDQTYDQTETISGPFTIVTDFSDEIYFDIFSGTPSTAGTATITSTNNDEEVITINILGVIEMK